MKFTLRDLIWATLVAALLLALGIGWYKFEAENRWLRSELSRALIAEEQAGALAELAQAVEQRIEANQRNADFVELYGKQIKTTIYAKCVRIIDGDTIECLDEDNNKFSVRLESIDTPERGEPFFRKAKDFTGDLCHEKTAALHVTGKDRWGRTLAFVQVDGKDVSVELLKAGLARHYKKYSDDKTLAGFEAEAKSNKYGIWQTE